MTGSKSLMVVDAHAARAALPDRRYGPWACETHPDRITNADDARKVLVIEPDGVIWDLLLTDDGFTIGDMKAPIGLCPECAAAVYSVEHLSPRFTYAKDDRQWGFMHDGTFIVDPRYDETYKAFEVDLAYYGLTETERAQLIRLNRLSR